MVTFFAWNSRACALVTEQKWFVSDSEISLYSDDTEQIGDTFCAMYKVVYYRHVICIFCIDNKKTKNNVNIFSLMSLLWMLSLMLAYILLDVIYLFILLMSYVVMEFVKVLCEPFCFVFNCYMHVLMEINI